MTERGACEFFAGLLCHHYAYGRFLYQRLLALGRRAPRFTEFISSRLDAEAYDVCVDDVVREVALEALSVSLKNLWME